MLDPEAHGATYDFRDPGYPEEDVPASNLRIAATAIAFPGVHGTAVVFAYAYIDDDGIIRVSLAAIEDSEHPKTPQWGPYMEEVFDGAGTLEPPKFYQYDPDDLLFKPQI